ncbi:MAG: PQQ-dependent sugar dehydrogenase, partial [Acidimicrobiia bacterium]|nr:PQQ-dependent sugar dehydrogenase [Acidimicrobiia bacterium]
VRSGLSWYLLENPAAGNRADRAIAFGNPNVVEAVRAPRLTVTPLVDGLSNPWDLAFTSDGAILMTERGGALSVRLADGTFRRLQADFSDLLVSGESGLLGIDVDTEFSTNRRFYTCQATLGPSVKVVAWQVDAAYTRAVRVADPLVGGLPSSGGRHGGCRPRVGFDGALWIGTGDAAIGSTPQDVGSLGGKVLRVDRFSGAAPADNPDHGGDRRVYSYGHRNVQGLAFRPGYYQVWTTEHGPDVDDEVNRIIPGNYGWNPVPGYNENVPMTDLARYPGAVPAAWSSGRPTLAVSGADFLVGRAWGSWRGGLAVAALKDQTLRIVMLNPAGAVIDVVAPPELFGTFGRLRSARLGPDGNLYVTTDNGTGRDALLRVTPS